MLEDESPRPEAAIRAILRDLPSLPDGIEQPAHLFRLLVDNLSLERAAILLQDYDEDIFVPWAANGLDATSLHRLRIPTSDLGMITDAGGTGLLWEGDDCVQFAPYFSRREGSVLDHVLMFPFVDDTGLQGILLVTETPYFDGYVDYLRIILAAVGEPAARTIEARRFSFTVLMRQSIVFKPGEIDVVAERIASRAPDSVTVTLVQFADVVSQVATANPYLDPFRIWQDVLRAVAVQFATTASVCDADGHRALLLIHGSVDDDTDLMLHHVAATIATLLPEVSDTPVLRHTTRRFPDDGDDLAALAASLL